MAITTTQLKQLSDGNSAGCQMGQSATDVIGFFGATPVVQQTGNTLITTTGIMTGGVFSTSTLSIAFVQAIANIQTALKNLGLTT